MLSWTIRNDFNKTLLDHSTRLPIITIQVFQLAYANTHQGQNLKFTGPKVPSNEFHMAKKNVWIEIKIMYKNVMRCCNTVRSQYCRYLVSFFLVYSELWQMTRSCLLSKFIGWGGGGRQRLLNNCLIEKLRRTVEWFMSASLFSENWMH